MADSKTVGVMRVQAAYDRYREACEGLGIDTGDWELKRGHLDPRPERREPWRIETSGPTPGIPDGILTRMVENSVQRLHVARRTITDLAALGLARRAHN